MLTNSLVMINISEIIDWKDDYRDSSHIDLPADTNDEEPKHLYRLSIMRLVMYTAQKGGSFERVLKYNSLTL